VRISSAAFALLASAAGALSAGCGSPDNIVYGSVSSADTTKFPDASIPQVHSAIHYNGMVTNLNTPSATPVPRSVVILSGQDGLCDSLKNTPLYFQTAPQGFTALILMTPTGVDGDFLLGGTTNTDASLLAAFRGQQVAMLPGVGGDVSVTEFNLSGNAAGTFNLVVAATLSAYPIYGRFKTNPCPAIAGAYLPYAH
jgi:hypothetical protein